VFGGKGLSQCFCRRGRCCHRHHHVCDHHHHHQLEDDKEILMVLELSKENDDKEISMGE